MKYKLNVREEIFGATILNLLSGERKYLDKKEYSEKFTNNGKFIYEGKIYNMDEIRFTKLKSKFKLKAFSFADVVFIEVTRACNLRCIHCLNNSGIALKNQLTKEKWIKIIRELSDAGVQEIRFTGGEPLVFPGIEELINEASNLGIYVSIGTNGILIDKEKATILKKAGLKKAVISLDGTEKSHDAIRGKGTYVKTWNAINLLKKENISLKVNSVIMKSNIDDVIELAKIANKTKTPIFIRRFIESGRGNNLKNNVLSAKDYEYVRKKLQSELSVAPYIRGHYIRIANKKNNEQHIIPFKIHGECKAGQKSFVITSNGDIHFCGFLASQDYPSIANVKEIDNFSEFWYKLQKQDKLKKLKDNLNRYNSQWEIQKTNCLAYVQHMLNVEQNLLKQKNLKIIISKYNKYIGQIEKLKNESIIPVEVREIEELLKTRNIKNFNINSIVYFVCCNSPLITEVLDLLKNINLTIINKFYLINKPTKIEIQKKLKENNVCVPKQYNLSQLNKKLFPIICKENRHQGKKIKFYNISELNEYLKKHNSQDYYFEELLQPDIEGNYIEFKIYYIYGKIFSSYKINYKEMEKLCRKISKSLYKIEVFSVDIIKKLNNYYVIDVNDSVGFYKNDDARKYFLESYLVRRNEK